MGVATFEELERAHMIALKEYKDHKGDDNVQAHLLYHAKMLSDVIERELGYEAEKEDEKPVRKKNVHVWTPEQRAAAAERLRARQAEKKASKE